MQLIDNELLEEKKSVTASAAIDYMKVCQQMNCVHKMMCVMYPKNNHKNLFFYFFELN